MAEDQKSFSVIVCSGDMLHMAVGMSEGQLADEAGLQAQLERKGIMYIDAPDDLSFAGDKLKGFIARIVQRIKQGEQLDMLTGCPFVANHVFKGLEAAGIHTGKIPEINIVTFAPSETDPRNLYRLSRHNPVDFNALETSGVLKWRDFTVGGMDAMKPHVAQIIDAAAKRHGAGVSNGQAGVVVALAGEKQRQTQSL